MAFMITGFDVHDPLLGVRTFAAAVRIAALAELASCVRHNRTTQGILEELLAKYWADRDAVESTAPGGRASQSGQWGAGEIE
jgi:hypothetical protein